MHLLKQQFLIQKVGCKENKKVADGNSAVLWNDFPFDPKEFLEKSLTF